MNIINDILDFSKIDAGQLVLDPQPFSLTEAIEDVAALISSAASEKGLELSVRVDPELPEKFIGDALAGFEQVVTNLVGNAVKFTDSGDVFIEAHTRKAKPMRTDQTDVLCFRSKIPVSASPRTEFRRCLSSFLRLMALLHASMAEQAWGLAISSSLVELMGGELQAESRVGEGSTFFFSIALPVHEEAKDFCSCARETCVVQVCLVVDDNEINRSILVRTASSLEL